MAELDPSRRVALEGDLALRRRVAWGLASGLRKAEVAEGLGLGLEELQVILASPGTYVLLNVWGLFHQHRQEGFRHLLAVVRWTLDFMLAAADRVRGPGLGRLQLLGIFCRLGLALHLRTLLRQIDAVAGLGTAPRLGPWRRRLQEAVAWGIETALLQRLIDKVGDAALEHLDARFRAVLAWGELEDFIDDVRTVTEEVEARLEAERQAAPPLPPIPRPILPLVRPSARVPAATRVRPVARACPYARPPPRGQPLALAA